MSVRLFVGTRKGLFGLRSDEDRAEWDVVTRSFDGWAVNSIDHDAATGVTYAAVTSTTFGPIIGRSEDMGETWEHSSEGLTFGEGADEVTEAWSVKAGIEPGVVYAGSRPAGLFRSDDGGRTWAEVEALRAHPSHDQWYPGQAGLILHTIVPHPTNSAHMWCGVSAAGVFKTEDGGETWTAQNAGVPAPWEAPEPPEVGQCCHKIRLAGGSADRIFQQNHMGQFRSDDGGASWESIQQDMPSEFGFALAVHPRDHQAAWFLPLVSPEQRFVPDGKPVVYRTRDGGASYEALHRGLPASDAFLVVLRDAMISDRLDPVGVYFGTSTGQVFASPDEGDTWHLAADFLPPVHVVHAA